MNTQTHETLSELHDFVANQAAFDAVLDPNERRYQAELVTDVLTQEPLKADVIQGLVKEYALGVASHLEAEQVSV